MRRTPIVTRLLAAFICVSLVPIGTLAALAIYESRGSEAEHVEEGAALGEESEEIAGIPTAALELASQASASASRWSWR